MNVCMYVCTYACVPMSNLLFDKFNKHLIKRENVPKTLLTAEKREKGKDLRFLTGGREGASISVVARIHVRMRGSTCAYAGAGVYAHVCGFGYACYVRVYVRVCREREVCAEACVWVLVLACVWVCACAMVRVCVHACAGVWCMHACG